MFRKYKVWLGRKPAKTQLLLFFGMQFVYWLICWILINLYILVESHSFMYYVVYAITIAGVFTLFNKWELVKLVFGRHNNKPTMKK